MCGRFTQAYTWQEVHEFYQLTGPARNLKPNYNAAPTQSLNVIVRGSLEMRNMRWGLVPSWWKKPLKELKASTFNARSETAAEKPMFRHAFKAFRCLVPATGFYEWKRSGKDKQPYHIHMADGSPMTFAGMWSPWNDKETGEEIASFTILTTEANAFMAEIHNRMPVVLTQDKFDRWLDDGDREVLMPCTDDLIVAYPVDKAVGNVRNNEPELLKAIRR